MDNNNIELKILNLPKKLSVDQKAIHNTFTYELKKIIAEYEFLLFGEVKKLCLVLIYNKNLSITNSIIYSNNLYFSIFNLPKFASDEQDTKNSIFRAKLDLLLKSYKFQPSGGADKLYVLLFYNQSFSNIKIQGMEEDKNEEDLVYFSPITPKHKMEQIIVNIAIQDQIQRALVILSQKSIIYEDWGFNVIDPEPKAILNFHGASGTGKTMMAHAIAHELKCKILALNYADIESKFVGDAPKNLVRAFEMASQETALLFFDEADSFLGKRIVNVSSSSDQAVNSLRSQMLILLENFEGIVIFATNLITNYDRAFESRIFKHIKFELPDFENRMKIILKMIPSKVPFENGEFLNKEQISILAKISDGFSGREIKNAILESLTCVVSDGRNYINFNDFHDVFISRKANREKLQNDYTQSPSDKKQALEAKIKQHLSSTNENIKPLSLGLNQDIVRIVGENNMDFVNTILDLACHVALSDGILHTEEKDIICRVFKAFAIDYEADSRLYNLTPLDLIIEKINSKDKVVKVIDCFIHIIASNGDCTPQEQKFMRNLCTKLKIDSEETVSQIISHVVKYAGILREWNYTKASLL